MTHEELLGDLIRIRSYSGQEQEIATYIGNWLRDRGIDSFNQNGNIVAHLEGKDPKRAFIFNSHMDTVTKGDGAWQSDPWIPTKVEDKLVGLGASDMKSGMAASMLFAEKVAAEGTPDVDMWFTYVKEEETDGSGTQRFANWLVTEGYPQKYNDMAGLFTEPNSLSEIEHGHRGNMFLQATTNGDSGHASRPEKVTKHAVREMINFADALNGQMELWKKEFSGTPFDPPSVGQLTSIRAGVSIKDGKEIAVESPNRFPSTCTATFDVRTTPDFHKVAFGRIKVLADNMGVELGYAFPPAPAGYTDPSERIVKVAQQVLPGSKLVISQGAADLGFLTEFGVKAVIIGPGEKSQAHEKDEYCYPAQIPEAVEVYGKIVNAWAKE